MFCSNCGEENRNDRKFCTNCGSQLKDYTKPLDNTISIPEIHHKQSMVRKYNTIIKALTISAIILILMSVCCIITSMILDGITRLLLISCSVIFIVITIAILSIAYKTNYKRKNINN